MLIGIGLVILAITVYYIYDAYRQSSKYTLAAEKMNIIGYEGSHGQRVSMEQQQEALLKIFHLAGYFNLSNLWQDLNAIGNLENLESIFEEISTVVKFSNADQPDPARFNAKYLRKNLFKSDKIDLQDALDLILYIAQHGFNRETGQERCELVPNDWINKYADEYRQAARLLGLIDREQPSLNEYDGSWIAGASRQGLSLRIIDFNNYLVSRNIRIREEIFVLAGERELWANIDGISPETSKQLLEASQKNIDISTIDLSSSDCDDSARIEEGKSYMMNLAEFYNIILNTPEPFIQYKSKDDCPPDRFPNRVYANYDTNETSKLTETLMSYDVLRTFLTSSANKVSIIDTMAQKQSRPNTVSTARDAAERLVKRIFAGDYGEKKTFVILLASNNPYIERQTLATQRQVNLILKDYGLDIKSYLIKIEGIGSSCKEPLEIVHSELAALIAEKWRIATADIGLKPKRDIKNLLFQTREQCF